MNVVGTSSVKHAYVNISTLHQLQQVFVQYAKLATLTHSQTNRLTEKLEVFMFIVLTKIEGACGKVNLITWMAILKKAMDVSMRKFHVHLVAMQ